jgi:hypothetical protein
MKATDLTHAQAQAKLLSRSTGVAYVHKFSDGYMVSIAKGSGKHIVEEYRHGELNEAWTRYHKELQQHEEQVAQRKPNANHYATEDAFRTAFAEWEKFKYMDAPNPPGYEIANND